jgi:hypothetical protein
MGIFFGNWYSQMIAGRVHGEFKDPRARSGINAAERLEKMLCDEGALIFKFWFHLSKKQMKARLKASGRRPPAQLAHQPAGLAAIGDLRPVREIRRARPAPHQSRLRAVACDRRNGRATIAAWWSARSAARRSATAP